MITVTRVENANGGSYVVPPLDPAWDEPVKLEWQAAVVSHDTGLTIVIHPGEAADRYCVDIRSPSGGTLSSAAPFDYHDAWTYLNGISAGHYAATVTGT